MVLLAAGMLAVGGAGFGLIGSATAAASTPASVAPEPTPTATASASPSPSRAPVAPSPEPTATPSPSVTPTPPPADPGTPEPVAAPTILSPADGELLSGTTRMTGTGEPGSTLQILAGDGSEPLCFAAADADGDWSCPVDGLPSSSSTTLRVVQLVDDGDQQQASVTVRVLTAPVVTGGPRGAVTNAVVQGSAFPGSAVTVSTGDGGFSCAATADGSGAFSCRLEGGIVDGDYSVSAVQTTGWAGDSSSPASVPLAIRVDVTVPAAPVLSAPGAGETLPLSGATFRGTGESGARVSVFAGAYVLCESVVTDGAWSCQATAVPAGRYSVAVLQQDEAGNVSVQSGPLTLPFGAAATPTPTPTASSGGASTPKPTKPGSAATVPPGGSAPGDDTGGQSTSPAAPEGSAPPSTTPGVPQGPETGTQTDPRALGGGTWADATRFTTSLQPALGAPGAWWVALLVALLVLGLVALPSRLLASTASVVVGRGDQEAAPRRLLARLLGRNRSRHEFEQAPELRVSPATKAGGVLLASAAIVTLSGPVLGQPAYLRLYLAAVLGLALVSAVATLLPAAIARRVFGIRSRISIRPGFVLVTAALALLSRLADLEPALVFGLVVGLAAAETADRAVRGRLAVVQVLGLLVLGGTAWLVAGALAAAAGTGGASGLGASVPGGDALLAAGIEFANVVVLASFGSACVLLLPVGLSSGKTILAWSPASWALLALAAYAALAMLFVPAIVTAAGSGGLIVPVVLAAGFGAVSLSAWAWMRFVAVDEDATES